MSMLSTLETKGRDWLNDREKSAHTATEEVRQMGQGVTQEVMGLKNKLEDKMHDIQAVEKRLYDEKQAQVRATTEEVRGLANATIREVSNLEHDLEARAAAAAQQRQDQLREATRSYLDEKLEPSSNGAAAAPPKGPS